MALISDLEDCCFHLESSKVTDRKKFCNKLTLLLDNKDVINILNEGKRASWKNVISSLQECLRKDSDKSIEDAKKKNSDAVTKSPSADLFEQVIDMAIREAVEDVDIPKLVGYIVGCMKDYKMKKCNATTFLNILQKYILSNSKCWGRLEADDWAGVYTFLKDLSEKRSDDMIIYKCLMLVIKWGPTSGFSPCFLRGEFSFMTKFCQLLSPLSPKPMQESTLEMALDFCQHTAKDNRVSCCKFGEDVLPTFVDLYELNGRENQIKELLVQFFLFQMVIHQPNGVEEGHQAAYAFSWITWKKCLKTVFRLLSREIGFYFDFRQKNTSFFKTDGELVTLSEDFTTLFVEISRQLFTYSDLDITSSLDCTSQIPQKRQKIDVSLKSYINNIQQTKSWLWIHLVSSLIKTYPKLLESDDYISLLQLLSSIQIESNDYNVTENIYVCLSTMLDVYDLKTISGRCEADKLWKVIGESTTRAFALNQHKEATENLLAKLIKNDVVDFHDILQTYTSGILNISPQSIRTLDSGLQLVSIGKSDDLKKENLMSCILNAQNFKDCTYLLCKETAEFLVKLTLKQWPSKGQENGFRNQDKFQDLKNIYLKTLLEESTLTRELVKSKEAVEGGYSVEINTAKSLTNLLDVFVRSSPESEEALASILVLLVNISSALIDFKIVGERDIEDSVLIDLIKKVLTFEKLKGICSYHNKSEREAKNLLKFVKIMDRLFSLDVNKIMQSKLKNLVPLEVLKALIQILNDLQEDQKQKCNLGFELKKEITRTLSSFGCVCGGELNQYQINILEVLSVPNYNCNLENDCTLLKTFLRTVRMSEPGVLPEKILENILESVHELCQARYQYSLDAVEILNILKDLFPHFAISTEENKVTSVALLKPFYDKRHNYGPGVSLVLLECLEELCRLDPRSEFARWSDVEVVRFIPEFLSSDYQEVRFKAADALVTYFRMNSKTTYLPDFHRQEEIFSKIYEMSLKVFNVEGELTQERRIDEVVSRTASVLHTFGGLILHCNKWIEECIVSLMKISYIKKIDSVDKILRIISERLLGETGSNIVERFLERIIERWLNEGRSIDDFQFKLLNCSTKMEFYLKYFEKCVPFFIVSDRKDLISAAKELGLSEKAIVEITAAKVFARALCADVENLGPAVLQENNILKYYSFAVGENSLKDILKDNLDQITLGVIGSLTDEKYILDHFDEVVIFPTSNLTVVQLEACFNFVESFLCDSQPLVTYLTKTNVGKIEKILLTLRLNIYNVISAEDKLKSLHRYTLFLSMITENLRSNSDWQHYFIRDTVHCLINLIENHDEYPSITKASCMFLNTFLRKILPNVSDTFKHLLEFTVKSLKLYTVTKVEISDLCVNILNFLIVDNSCHLLSEIEKLDNFSQHPNFSEIRRVHEGIKYGEKRVSLEDEINSFLKHNDVSTQQDSLIHLRKLLSEQKSKVMELYDNLQSNRGFSEDCEKSCLHRLVCALAKLSCSPNEKVSFEAVRCLGELGPANLQTLVLQPERAVFDLQCTPFELLTGNVISLLSEYVVDSDVNVVKTASETFYLVLDCKEGRKLAESNKDFGYGPINKNYIKPYFPLTRSSPSSNSDIDVEICVSKLSDDTLWCPRTETLHKQWILNLVSAILESFTNQSYLQKLTSMCKVKTKFSERILPLLINLLVSFNISRVNNMLSKMIDFFFSEHWDLTVSKLVDKKSIALNKKSVKCMLAVVSFVRLQKSFNKPRSRSNTNTQDLNIDYLKAAKAAQFCSAHFSTLLYTELWCQTQIENIQNENPAFCEQRSTMIDFIYERVGREAGEALQHILRNAYKAVGDLNALPGCGISFLLEPQFRVEHYKEQEKWDQVTQFYATRIFSEPHTSLRELMESFKKCSWYQMPLLCGDKLEEPQYECMWRLGQWTTSEKRNVSSSMTRDDFEKYRFFALKSLRDKNVRSFDEALKYQKLCVIDHLKHASLESCQNLYPVLSRMQSLVEIEDFAKGDVTSIVDKWVLQDRLVRKNDFQYIEPIVTQRLVMLADRLRETPDVNLQKFLVEATLDFAGLAKEEGHFKEGLAILENLKCMSDLTENVKTRIQLLDAQLSWLVNNTIVARHILNKLCKNESISPKLRATALTMSGQFMSETHSENRMVIIKDYFLKSISLMSRVERNERDIKNVMDTYDKLAVFADNEYQQIKSYMQSELFQKKKNNIEKARRTASDIKKQRKRTKDEEQAASIHYRQSNIDETEINNTIYESNFFLEKALKYYFLSLAHSEEKNMRVFRIMSLFLENRNNNQIVGTITEQIPKIPTFKYIVMLPQLIPHISDTSTDLFSSTVNEIVVKCAKDHPHHTLPLILSLSNANKDVEYGNTTKTSANDARVATANRLLVELKEQGLGNHIKKLMQLSLALIDLAYLPIPNENNMHTIPRNQAIMKIRDFEDVLVPTYTLNVDERASYSKIVGISSFGSEYRRVGGIHHPKRITCRGTDGKLRSQLVKGCDDLRQDAVMQQVFNIMNNLLSTNKQTRNLLIRTYKIVPLSMRSGILEWVDDTMQIGSYLVGEEKQLGAHQIYRPSDKSPAVCRSLFKGCAGKSVEIKLKTYKDICRSFKPVFHKFFESFFPQPTIWYERRRAYIHSVATTSMCGYILGIGDRHVSNILIDKITAEVVHIDFGIAFEQGKVLPTPEAVPFRLTRDMVDGMGVCGVEGIFKRSCENTMEVLRQNAQTIITILEVLLYDPLYVWTVTAAEANRRQTDDGSYESTLSSESTCDEDAIAINNTAERALLRLREKLQGTELGHPTSIEHQVGTLIQQAIDPENLCKHFVGWQPYL
ncbi:serine/threonine-protein kinase tefu [Leptinotarsa decemlineata]|uniref:serine/threonine-protein kinase tefu n=1 Tax=Leptinotarsa decemlineata TaxID=7539 RepID=UPI003D30CAD4